MINEIQDLNKSESSKILSRVLYFSTPSYSFSDIVGNRKNEEKVEKVEKKHKLPAAFYRKKNKLRKA